jgi:hypothetical protein
MHKWVYSYRYSNFIEITSKNVEAKFTHWHFFNFMTEELSNFGDRQKCYY